MCGFWIWGVSHAQTILDSSFQSGMVAEDWIKDVEDLSESWLGKEVYTEVYEGEVGGVWMTKKCAAVRSMGRLGNISGGPRGANHLGARNRLVVK